MKSLYSGILLVLLSLVLLTCIIGCQKTTASTNTTRTLSTTTSSSTPPPTTITTVSPSTTTTTTQSTTATPPTSTAPPPTSTVSNAIKIGFSSTTLDQGGSILYWDSTMQGNIYLVILFTIQNSGYTSFSVSPSDFSVIVNSIKYNYLPASRDLDRFLSSATVLNGDTLVGKLAYLIPTSVVSLPLTPTWEGQGSYNIIWSAS